MNHGSIFIGGAERSGKTFIRLLLSAHPNIIFSRRTNLWPHFYGKYGNLGQERNFARCLAALARNKHVQALDPDWPQLRREFRTGRPTYARLFALLHEQHARRAGKPRWGDQTEFIERFAGPIFAAYPNARMIHLIRDPRDQYAAAISEKSRPRDHVGYGTARWRYSAALAGRNQALYPGRYQIVRYEALVMQPEETLRDLCHFLDEPYLPAMLALENAPRFQNQDNTGRTSPLSAAFIGRYTDLLSPFEIAFIEKYAGPQLRLFDYRPETGTTLQSRLRRLPRWSINRTRLVGWHALKSFQDARLRRTDRSLRRENRLSIPAPDLLTH